MSLRKLALAGVLAIALQGCASMSSQECQVSDWYAVGYTDGAMGRSASQYDDYRKDCAEHGVQPDFDAYRSGRDEGLREYCQPESAFNLGSRGGSNPGYCPGEMRDAFAEAFQSGRNLFELRSALQQVEHRLSLKNKRLKDLQAHEYEIEATLVSSQPTVEQRLQLLLDLKNLAAEKQQLQDEMFDLQEEHAYHQQRLAAYEVALYQSS